MFLAGQLLRRIPAGAELPASPQPSSGLTKPSGAGRGISLSQPAPPRPRLGGGQAGAMKQLCWQGLKRLV